MNDAQVHVQISARVRGMVLARLFGKLPGPIGRAVRRRIHVETRVESGPWHETWRWVE